MAIGSKIGCPGIWIVSTTNTIFDLQLFVLAGGKFEFSYYLVVINQVVIIISILQYIDSLFSG